MLDDFENASLSLLKVLLIRNKGLGGAILLLRFGCGHGVLDRRLFDLEDLLVTGNVRQNQGKTVFVIRLNLAASGISSLLNRSEITIYYIFKLKAKIGHLFVFSRIWWDDTGLARVLASIIVFLGRRLMLSDDLLVRIIFLQSQGIYVVTCQVFWYCFDVKHGFSAQKQHLVSILFGQLVVGFGNHRVGDSVRL